ncbi:putative RING-H2 finger protein ATL21B [Argentina anserina]|uniref:putative RING-H2 finger protein ATL21B n=1 Tax=Argentina anserina TaxID=57926 RepID=UPI0021769068|nr:putative RING-H2 finger protein ATL21B [Potentilla anserina]
MALPSLELFSFLFIFLFFLPHIAFASCAASKCSHGGPQVRFPFTLTNRQGSRCGYPKFGLTCDSVSKQTIITLPSTPGDFFVRGINYRNQIVSIYDTAGTGCLIKRFLDQEISLAGSAFVYTHGDNYTFFNCSPKAEEVLAYYPAISCLSSDDNRVIAVPSNSITSSGPPIPSDLCFLMSKAFVPVDSSPFLPPNVSDWECINIRFQLSWTVPDCRYCELSNKVCRIEDAPSLQIGCFRSPPKGLSSSARTGLIIGLGIPGFVGISGLVMFIMDRMKTSRQDNRTTVELSNTATNEQPSVVTEAGLDAATIESYPKSQLGESVDLPNPDDKVCSICLTEYEVKDILRSIPECNHYFHAICIDQWLKKNSTCPLCRNPPDRE